MTARFAVVGTAGHIDHGKTALVGRLTGVDTDRLKEEKQRGISIDLGFAPLPLSEDLMAGVVDVPGHERFIRNMLAGVGGIDLVLLVVAVDEGVMPQTREHLAILELLRVPRCVAVLTKCDLVDAEYAAMARRELEQFLSGTRFAGAPVVLFSAHTGAGEAELRTALRAALAELPLRDASGPARLPVDRVFTREGFGTVVTGTLWRGRVRAGDLLTLWPQGKSLRVRTVESHGQRVEEVTAGRRAALSLHPLGREEAARGDWLVGAGADGPSRRVSVRLELLKDAPRPLGARTAVRFHLGATEVLGILRLLGREGLEPGGTALAQIELRRPTLAERGDRFVVRVATPMATIGGGVVIEPRAERLRARNAEAVDRLERLERGTPQEQVIQALERLSSPGRTEEIAKAAGVGVEEARASLAHLNDSGGAVRVGESFVGARRWAGARERILSEVAACQKEFPLRYGIGKGELKSRLSREQPAGLFDALLARCVEEGALYARGDRVALSAEVPLPTVAEAGARRIRSAARAAGLQARFQAELSAEGGPQGQEVLQRLLFERELVKLPGELVFDRSALEVAAAAVAARLRSSPRLTIADFKDLFGLSRKYLVPLMEHFDSVGVTRREGEARVAGKGISQGRGGSAPTASSA